MQQSAYSWGMQQNCISTWRTVIAGDSWGQIAVPVIEDRHESSSLGLRFWIKQSVAGHPSRPVFVRCRSHMLRGRGLYSGLCYENAGPGPGPASLGVHTHTHTHTHMRLSGSPGNSDHFRGFTADAGLWCQRLRNLSFSVS